MLWNELEHDLQLEVLRKISLILSKEKDKEIRMGLTSALYELYIWSSLPGSESDIEIVEEKYEPNPISKFEPSVIFLEQEPVSASDDFNS